MHAARLGGGPWLRRYDWSEERLLRLTSEPSWPLRVEKWGRLLLRNEGTKRRVPALALCLRLASGEAWRSLKAKSSGPNRSEIASSDG